MEPSREHLRVETVRPEQAAELVALGDEAGLSAWTEESYRDLLAQPGSIVLGLAEDGKPTVGFIAGQVVPGPEGPDAEVYNIAVASRLRGSGLAGGLVNAFVAECRARGVRNVWLEVRGSNSTAIGFYEKNGFWTVRTRAGYYHEPLEDALIMCLDVATQIA